MTSSDSNVTNRFCYLLYQLMPSILCKMLIIIIYIYCDYNGNILYETLLSLNY